MSASDALHTPRSWPRHEMILMGLLLLQVLWFHQAGPRFSTWDNTTDILRHSTEIGLLALALTPVILTGGIDLSVGSLLGLSAVCFGKLWRDAGLPIPVAAALTLILGTAAGGLNAILITRCRLPPLIVTLGTYSLFRGLAEALTRGVDTFTDFPPGFLALGQQSIGGFLPVQAPLLLGVFVLVHVLVHHTTWGRSLRAIGFRPEGALHAGLPVRRQVASTYLFTGFVVALAALLYTARLGQAKADAGTGYELYAITAVVLGGASIFGGTGSVGGTFLGVLVIAVLNNGLVHARQPREMAGLLTGAILLVALALSRVPLPTRPLKRKPGGDPQGLTG